jgi:hypothetical protein
VRAATAFTSTALARRCSVETAGTGSGDGSGSGSGDGSWSGSGTGSGTGSGGVVPDWVSGTRLRARVQTSADGARAFYGWYDS